MSSVYEGTHRINYYDLDYRATLKLSAFLRLVHIAADANASDLGCGFTDLSAKNMSFVLSRFSLCASRWPGYGENVVIRTWPHSIKAGTFFRKGQMLVGNAILIEWISQWILFDISERKILRPAALSVELPPGNISGVDFEPKKVVLPESGDWLLRYRHNVSYADVDTNMHTNNSVYGDFLANALFEDIERARSYAIGMLHLNYVGETYFGEQVEVFSRRSDGSVFMRGMVGEKVSFTAEVVM